ncbi:MAG: hypothetical protein V4726_07155 [Verrucomicrobiota bacterium]
MSETDRLKALIESLQNRLDTLLEVLKSVDFRGLKTHIELDLLKLAVFQELDPDGTRKLQETHEEGFADFLDDMMLNVEKSAGPEEAAKFDQILRPQDGDTAP